MPRNPFEIYSSNQLKGDSLTSGAIDETVYEFGLHSHDANLNAHFISNITGLQDALDSKDTGVSGAITAHENASDVHDIDAVTNLQSALNAKQNTLSGVTGNVTVITSVDFGGSTTTSATLTFDNGVLVTVS